MEKKKKKKRKEIIHKRGIKNEGVFGLIVILFYFIFLRASLSSPNRGNLPRLLITTAGLKNKRVS